MSTEYVAGFIVGFVLVFAVILIVKKLIRKHVGGVVNGKCSYDERQEIVRGKAFKYGFFSMMICNIILGLGPDILETELPMVNSITMFLGVAVGVIVFATYAIWNEGYFGLNERPKGMLMLFAFIAAINAFTSIMNGLDGNLVADGILQMGFLSVICSVMFVIVFGVVLIKSIVRKNED